MEPRASSAALAAVAAAALLLLAAPAGAALDHGVAAPEEGETITGQVTVAAFVETGGDETAQGMQARLSGPAEVTVDLRYADGQRTGGRSTWTATLDPLDPDPLPNGAYLLQASPRTTTTERPTWIGYDVVLRVPPPPVELTAQPAADAPTTVALAWSPVALPDFVAYQVERRPADAGGWEVVQEHPDAAVTEASDTPATPGAYVYRLRVLRGDGDDGQIARVSEPRGVRADAEDPGTFEPGPDPDAAPDDAEGPVQRPGAPAPTPGDEAGPPEPQPAPLPPPARPPDLGVPAAPPAPAPPPAGPAPEVEVPLPDDTFQELLPFTDTTTEVEVSEEEFAFRDGPVDSGGTVHVIYEESRARPVLTAAAAGLLLLVIAAHVRRWVSAGARP